MKTMCRCYTGSTGKKMTNPIDTPAGRGMCFKPMIGGGSGNALLGTPTSANPPFFGREQLDTQGFYSLGKGTKGLPAPPMGEMNRLADKLSRLHVKPAKALKKNIKINF